MQEIKNQDLFIIAPSYDKVKEVHDQHPIEEGAQDIVIGNTNGLLYHCSYESWRNDKTKVKLSELPSILRTMYQYGAVLAHLPLNEPLGGDAGSSKPSAGQGERQGYYLANFAILNSEQSTGGDPPGGIYQVPQSVWYSESQPLNHMFWPGNSGFLLEILSRGAAISYITKAARTMDCFCYLINLASLNGKPYFEPTLPDAPKCEIRTDQEKR